MNEELAYFEEELSKIRPDLSYKDIRRDAMKMAKHRWIMNGDKWELGDGIASELSKEEFFKLQVKKDTLPKEPDFTEHKEIAVASFKKYPHQFSLYGKMEVIEEVSNLAFSEYIKSGSVKDDPSLKNKRPSDYILLKSTLCTSLPFVNANGDAFQDTDLVEAVESGQLDRLQPAIVDWRHDFQVYGTTIGAEAIDTEIEITGIGKNKVKQIVAYSVFHAWLFPEKAKKLRKWAEKGVLGFSMACGAEKISYLNGGSIRVLEKPHFVANSIIPPDADPADDNARLLEIAGKKENIPLIYSDYLNVPKNLTCAWYKPDEKIPAKNTGEDMDNVKLIEDLRAEVEALKLRNAELEKSEAAKKIAELESKIQVLGTEKEAYVAEKSEYDAKLQKAESDLASANALVQSVTEKLKELRESEVKRINDERKSEIAKVVGDDENKINYWLDQFKASVDENGEILNDKEGFEKAMSNMPVFKAQTEIKDVEPSEKVKESEKNKALATASTKDEKKLFSKTMA